MSYKSEKLGLQSQAIAGPRTWVYSDTGTTAAALNVAAGIPDGRVKGLKVGDIFIVTPASAAGVQSQLRVVNVQADDTGVQYAELGDTGY